MESVVHLIRHGKVHNPANVRYGRAPGFHLLGRWPRASARGGRHLRDLGAPLAAFISSPLERAVETADIIAEQLACATATTIERLIEAYNELDGLHRWAFLQPWRWPRLWNPFRPSWGEPFSSIAARMRRVIEERRVPGAAIALVSHQAPIWIARQSYERPGPPWLGKVRCTQASVTTLRFDGDRYVGHLYWAPP